jgi:hypothetical protein
MKPADLLGLVKSIPVPNNGAGYFSLSLLAQVFFWFRIGLAGNFFSKSPTPPLKS